MAASMRFAHGTGMIKFVSRSLQLKKTNSSEYTYMVRCMSTPPASDKDEQATQAVPVSRAAVERGKKISQAMKSYLERSKAHTAFMQEEIAEYEIGKRHLAVIMGEDPDTFSQDDIDRAIQYLLPSGLYDKKARPMLRHPTEVIPARKEAQFDVEGRPFHTMFFTGKANFFQLMHDAGVKLEQLQQHEDSQQALGLKPAKTFHLSLGGSRWIPRDQLEKVVQEKLTEGEYVRFVKLMDRIVAQPYAAKEFEFVTKYRQPTSSQSVMEEIPVIQYDENGRGFVDAKGKRKTAVAQVRVWQKGTGRITINGRTMIEHFPQMIDREQILFPLQLCNVVDTVDIVATIEGMEPGIKTVQVYSGHAGAFRLAISRALRSFVSKELSEKMRLAGLLTHDPRKKERKKFGQEGARRKNTWKKR